MLMGSCQKREGKQTAQYTMGRKTEEIGENAGKILECPGEYVMVPTKQWGHSMNRRIGNKYPAPVRLLQANLAAELCDTNWRQGLGQQVSKHVRSGNIHWSD